MATLEILKLAAAAARAGGTVDPRALAHLHAMARRMGAPESEVRKALEAPPSDLNALIPAKPAKCRKVLESILEIVCVDEIVRPEELEVVRLVAEKAGIGREELAAMIEPAKERARRERKKAPAPVQAPGLLGVEGHIRSVGACAVVVGVILILVATLRLGSFRHASGAETLSIRSTQATGLVFAAGGLGVYFLSNVARFVLGGYAALNVAFFLLFYSDLRIFSTARIFSIGLALVFVWVLFLHPGTARVFSREYRDSTRPGPNLFASPFLWICGVLAALMWFSIQRAATVSGV